MSRAFAVALFLPFLAGAGLPHAQGICGPTYEVIRGDTLYSIARLCGSSVTAIAGASRLADPRRIETGQELIIPGWRAPEPDKEAAGEPAPIRAIVRTYVRSAPAPRDRQGDDDVDDPTRGPQGM